MGRFFAFGFIILPLMEIATFIFVGRSIGILATLALVLLAAIAGGLILRSRGMAAVMRMRDNVSAGTIPGQAIFDAMVIGFAAILLIIPGFISDIAALILLIPAVRSMLFQSLSKRFTVVETTTTWRRHGDDSDPRLANNGVIDLDDQDWRRES